MRFANPWRWSIVRRVLFPGEFGDRTLLLTKLASSKFCQDHDLVDPITLLIATLRAAQNCAACGASTTTKRRARLWSPERSYGQLVDQPARTPIRARPAQFQQHRFDLRRHLMGAGRSRSRTATSNSKPWSRQVSTPPRPGAPPPLPPPNSSAARTSEFFNCRVGGGVGSPTVVIVVRTVVSSRCERVAFPRFRIPGYPDTRRSCAEDRMCPGWQSHHVVTSKPPIIQRSEVRHCGMKMNRLGFDAGIMVGASPAGASDCERSSRPRTSRTEWFDPCRRWCSQCVGSPARAVRS
jgi:hypothetical protein